MLVDFKSSNCINAREGHSNDRSLAELKGLLLGVIGLAFVVAGGFAFMKVQEGTASLKAFSAAQGVELSYNEDGQLVDGGEVEGAQGIMSR